MAEEGEAVPLTILLRLFHDLLALFAPLRIGQDQPQSDGDEGSEAPQGVVGGGLDQLLSTKVLLVEHVLVLHLEEPKTTHIYRLVYRRKVGAILS